MSFVEQKKRLNIDQANILICTVIADSDTSVQVRTPRYGTRTASKPFGETYKVGQTVEVHTDGKVFRVVGGTVLSSYAAQLTVEI